MEYVIAAMYTFYLFIHVVFGLGGEADGEPATFIKYLMAPFYVLIILLNVFIASFPVYGYLSAIPFLYMAVVVFWAVINDMPIDRDKRKIECDDGSKRKRIITNDG